MKRKILIAVGVVCALLIGVTLVGFTAREIPAVSRHAIDLDAWRALAGDATRRPVAVRVLQVSTNRAAHWYSIEGGAFDDSFDMRGYAFQVVYADGTTGIIDPINDEASQKEVFPDSTFDQAAWDRMQQALRRAKWIIATHEHFDHVNGVVNSPHFDEIIDRVAFTRAQLDADLDLNGIDERTRARAKPLDYTGTHVISPGVVLIEAPSHTPGSQLIYIRLADDREMLMVGDVAWNTLNITRPATRPRFVEWAMGELGDETVHWLRALKDLRASHPAVLQIVAHDPEPVEDAIARGLLVEGLLTGP